MTKYGSTAFMQDLAWGGQKSSTPARVTAVQNQVTALINIVLNRNEDFTTVPEIIHQIANTVGSDMLRLGPKIETAKILETIKVLSKGYMDQAPASETNWGNVRIL